MEANARMPATLFKKLVQTLNPKQILTALTAIDDDAKKERAQLNDDIERKRVWLIILVACVCLLMVNYLKYSSVLMETIRIVEGWFDIKNQQWSREFRYHPYRELLGYVWWGF